MNRPEGPSQIYQPTPSSSAATGDLLDLPLGDEGEDLQPAPPPPRVRLRPQPKPPRRRWPWVVALLLLLPLAGAAGYLLNLSPAVVTASSELLDFGELRLGSEGQEQALSLLNTGKSKLVLGEAELMGEGAAAFSWVENACEGRQLASGERCDLRLRFAPESRGPVRARLVVSSDAANGRLVVPLLGAGLAPRARLDPARLAFEPQPIDNASPPQTAWLVNDGNAPLELGRARLLGLGSADFFIREDSCSGANLLPGQRCSVETYFIPTAPGERLASVEIPGDAPEEAPSVVLVGNGLEQQPILTLDAAELDFGSVLRGSSAEDLVLVLANEGTGPLEIDSVSLDPAESAFAISAEDCTETPLGPEATCSVTLSFAPPEPGAFEARLILDHGLEDGQGEVPLSGLGTAPGISLSVSRLSFGEVSSGSLSPVAELRIANDGSGSLQLGAGALAGGDAESFLVRQDGCSGRALAPGIGCAIEIAFKPRRDGPHRGVLDLRHDAEGERARIPLTGIGVSPRLETDPTRVSFGQVALASSSSQELRLSNPGRASLALGRLRFGGRDSEEFTLAADGCSGRQVAPKQGCVVQLRFSPAGPGPRSAILRIESSIAGEPREVTLEGRGGPPPQPAIEARPAGLELAGGPIGERSSIQSIALANTGAGELILDQISLVGAHPGDFRLVPGSCEGRSFVAAGGSCTVGVQAIPTASGERRAILQVQHNAPGEMLEIPLASWGEE